MGQKSDFIREWRSGSFLISEVSWQFEISLPKAYKYIARFQKKDVEVSREKFRAHSTHPQKIAEKIDSIIIYFR